MGYLRKTIWRNNNQLFHDATQKLIVLLKSKVSQNTANLLSNYKCGDMFRLTESSWDSNPRSQQASGRAARLLRSYGLGFLNKAVCASALNG